MGNLSCSARENPNFVQTHILQVVMAPKVQVVVVVVVVVIVVVVVVDLVAVV